MLQTSRVSVNVSRVKTNKYDSKGSQEGIYISLPEMVYSNRVLSSQKPNLVNGKPILHNKFAPVVPMTKLKLLPHQESSSLIYTAGGKKLR